MSVTDVAPVITSATTTSVTEATAANSTVYTAVASDVAGGTVTYSLTGTDAGAFTINSATGVVTINAVPDFETKPSYSFNVKAADPSGAFTTQAVTVNVTDLPPVISSATTATVAEGTSTATVVYTASATDPAGGTVTYALTGTDAGAFTINAATGAVTFNAVPDFETKTSYSFNVKASDASGAFNSQAVTVSVTDVIETSTVTLSSTGPASVVEGSTIRYTATVDNAVTGSALDLTLSNGSHITIGVGQTSGFVDVPVRADDAVSVVSSSGGRFEAVRLSGTVSTKISSGDPVPPPPPAPLPPSGDPAGPKPPVTPPVLLTPDPTPVPPTPSRPVDPVLQNQPVNLTGQPVSSTGPVPGATPGAPAPEGPAAGQVTPATAADVINALPPTAAGAPTGSPLTVQTDQGFQVALITSNSTPGRSAELGSIAGARLFVLEGVPDVQADKQFQLSPESFAHTDPNAVIKLEARQSNGEPLPAWLTFNTANGTFSGSPPEGKPTPVEVQVVARDNQAREASVIFKLELGVAGSAVAALESSDRGFPVSRVGANVSTGATGTPDDAKSLAGDRLFVLDGVRNAVGNQQFQLPQEAFAHTDTKAVVKLEARQASGEPLPGWLEFDAASGLFRGTPPDGRPVSIEVVVIARDNQAREASVVFNLELGVPGADAPGAQPARDGAAGGAPKLGAGTPAEKPPAGTGSAPQSGAGLGVPVGEALKLAQGRINAALGTDDAGAAVRGFQVARVSGEELQRVSGSDGQAASEQRLFVFQGVLVATGDALFQVPTDAFGHTDPSAIVQLEARNADGTPLPPWLQFDALTGIFRGTPPGGVRTLLEIVLTARDEEGREANLAFTLELGVKPSEAEPAKADVVVPAAGPRAAVDASDEVADEEADGGSSDSIQVGEKGKVEKAKPAKSGAAPFGEQVRAAKAARDPLLAKILGAKPNQTNQTNQTGRPTT